MSERTNTTASIFLIPSGLTSGRAASAAARQKTATWQHCPLAAGSETPAGQQQDGKIYALRWDSELHCLLKFYNVILLNFMSKVFFYVNPLCLDFGLWTFVLTLDYGNTYWLDFIKREKYMFLTKYESIFLSRKASNDYQKIECKFKCNIKLFHRGSGQPTYLLLRSGRGYRGEYEN